MSERQFQFFTVREVDQTRLICFHIFISVAGGLFVSAATEINLPWIADLYTQK